MRTAHCVRAVFPQHGFGGLERAGAALTSHLLARGLDVALLTRPLPPGEPFHIEPEWSGCLTVHGIQYGRLPLRPNGIPARLTNYRTFVERMGMKVEHMSRADYVSGIYAQGLCAWGVRSAPEWGVPMVANPQGMEDFKVRDPLKRLAYTPFRAWVRAGCRAADRVIATDYANRDEVPSLLGVDPGKVVVIPNGVDVQLVQQAINPSTQRELALEWGLDSTSSAKLRGISVGRLEANKGFAHLLRALHSVSTELPVGWRWLIVGDGSLRGELEELAAELGLSEHVRFTGSVTDAELHNLYSLSNLFAHPTLYEGSSLVTLEAMGHGLPVVASAVGGIPDKVVEGETGFLVQPADSGTLADRIAWLAARQGESAEMGARGRLLATEKFGWDRIAAQTEELFLELLEEKAACRPPSRWPRS